MKIKLTFMIGMLSACTLLLQAQSIDEETARAEACRFFNERITKIPSKRDISRQSPRLKLAEKRMLSNNETAYYIFNRGETDGFVVVGAQNEPIVLGYADEGSFDPHNIPDGLRELLNSYADELEWAANQTQSISASPKGSTPDKPAIAPLCEAMWNQDDPYNRLTPIINGKHAPTGCVATAMSILMYHHRWPEQGSGSYGDVDFSKARYNWEQMTPTYGTGSEETACTEVAELMYHCGVAVKMKYGATESAAFSTNIAPALNDYFGYNGVLYAEKDQYGIKTWEDLIYNELSENRPLYYAGGVHAFVCDGYDGNGYFHFNFGWGGHANGYFRLYAIRLSDVGIGGGAGDYSSGQCIVYGIERPDANRHVPLSIIGYGSLFLTDSQNGSFGYNADVINAGEETISIETGIEIKPSNGGDSQFHFITTESFPAQYNERYFFDIPLDNLPELPIGEYNLYPIYRITGKNQTKVVPFPSNKIQYLSLTVSNEGKNFSLPAIEPIFTSQITPKHELYSGKRADFDIKLSVTGYEYSGDIQLLLTRTDNSYSWSKQRPVDLTPGDTIDFSWSEILIGAMDRPVPAGEYKLQLRVKYQPICEQDITVLPAPETSVLELVSPIAVKNQGCVSPDKFEASFTVRCTSGCFIGCINAFCYDKASGNGIAQPFESDFLVLKEGEEQTYVYNSLLTAEQGTIATVDIFTDLDNDGIGEIIGPTEYNSVPFMIAPEHYLAIDDVTVFPDTAFQKYLHTIDWLNDGYMSDYEFNETTYINVNERNITTLKGLEFFKNLTRLDCLNNKLQAVDLSGNTHLSEVNCQHNNIDTLIFENHPDLAWLACGDNRIEELRISNSPKLTYLSCEDNRLRNFSFGILPALQDLLADNNPLDDIDQFDFTRLPSLKMFRLSGSNATTFRPTNDSIRTLVIGGNTMLEELNVSGCTELSTFHLQNCPRLANLSLTNEKLTSVSLYENSGLSYLDVSSCTSLSDFECSGSPLFMLDLSSNTALSSATFRNGRDCTVTVNDKNCFDLTDWIGQGFRIDRMSNLQNASVKDNSLHFGASYVQYDYLTGNDILPSIPVTLQSEGWASGISMPKQGNKVYAIGREIIIEGYQNESISVYTMTGKHLFDKQAQSFTVPTAGIYIVKVNDRATLVSVP